MPWAAGDGRGRALCAGVYAGSAHGVCAGDLPGARTRARCPRESFPAEVSELSHRQVCEEGGAGGARVCLGVYIKEGV